MTDALVISDFRRVEESGGAVLEGTTVDEIDYFETRNEFIGPELGVAADFSRQRWSLELLMKLAIGSTYSRVAIDGTTTVVVPIPGREPDVVTTDAGLLAQATNIGGYKRNQLAVMPELGATVGFDVTRNLKATVGYTFVYWSRVARPGDQIDTDLNLSQLTPNGLVGAPRPEFSWVMNDYWVHGLSLGLEGRF